MITKIDLARVSDEELAHLIRECEMRLDDNAGDEASQELGELLNERRRRQIATAFRRMN